MMQISKTLSANDLGMTGAHQAGMHVPKDGSVLPFFPPLDQRARNPRMPMVVRDVRSGTTWTFQFIYYNNRQNGGTRNEYRLTHMTKFLRQSLAVPGDELLLTREADGSVTIGIRPASHSRAPLPSARVAMNRKSMVRETQPEFQYQATPEADGATTLSTVNDAVSASGRDENAPSDVLVLSGGWKVIRF
jgi:hypothetical protein